MESQDQLFKGKIERGYFWRKTAYGGLLQKMKLQQIGGYWVPSGYLESRKTKF